MEEDSRLEVLPLEETVPRQQALSKGVMIDLAQLQQQQHLQQATHLKKERIFFSFNLRCNETEDVPFLTKHVFKEKRKKNYYSFTLGNKKYFFAFVL